MKLEFLDMLADARHACGLRNKMKFIFAVLLHVIGLHLRLRWISDKLVKSILTRTVVSIEGSKFYLLDADSLGLVSPRFEQFVDPWFGVSPGDVILDVGAHIGRYTIRFAWKAERVMAIEPNAETFRALVRNVGINGINNVIALNVAAWNERTNLVLYSGLYASQNSLKHRSRNGEVVHCETLDLLVSLYGCPRVDWIKVDVEQAEVEVLKGAEKTILGMKPRIIVEVWSRNEQRLRAFVEKIGYGAVQISPWSRQSQASSLSSYWLLTPLVMTRA